jgi:hypothetical protein
VSSNEPKNIGQYGYNRKKAVDYASKQAF